MINLFKNSNNSKLAKLLITTNILNLLILSSILMYSVLYYLDIKILLLSYLLLFFSLTALSIKLYYWKLLNINLNKNANLSRLFLMRIAFCSFTYLTPVYYIFKNESFVMSKDVILVTLIIILIIAFIGFYIERYLFYIESENTNNLFHLKKSN